MDSRDELADVLEKHHVECFGWALGCCRWDPAEAEDVLQSTYLKVLEGRARFRGESSFKTWIFAVIRRTAAEHRRRERLRSLVPWPFGAGRERDDQPSPDPVGRIIEAEEAKQLAEALDRLTHRQREVLHLVFRHEMSIAEAAKVMGVSLGTARTHYERGKRALRKLLSSPGGRDAQAIVGR